MIGNNTNPDVLKKRINKIQNTSSDIGEDIEVLNADIEKLNASITEEYNPETTYNVGDMAIIEGVLKKCNTASTTGTYDPTKWDTTTIIENLGGLEFKTKTYVGTGDTSLVLTFDTRPKFFMFMGYNDIDVPLAVPLTPLPQVEDEQHSYMLNYDTSYSSGIVELTDAETNEYTFTGGDSGLALNGAGKTETILYLD